MLSPCNYFTFSDHQASVFLLMCLLILLLLPYTLLARNSAENANHDQIPLWKNTYVVVVLHISATNSTSSLLQVGLFFPPSVWHCHSYNRALCSFLRAFACWNIVTWNKGWYFTFTMQCREGGAAGTLMCSKGCSIWLTGTHWLHKTQVVHVKCYIFMFHLSTYQYIYY